MNFEIWEKLFKEKIQTITTAQDPAHDILHFERVVKMAKTLCKQEQAQFEIVIPAAWLHDFVIIPKNSPLRSRASKLSAEKAIEFLEAIHYPIEFYEGIFHAIEAHSFSANIPTKTVEAALVQDADRLDGLGAIGIARCLITAGLLKRPLYNPIDPFCEFREPDDSQFTIDHFFAKLFRVAETMNTKSGQEEAQKRVTVMKSFLEELKQDI